jgi:hypothetical protein
MAEKGKGEREMKLQELYLYPQITARKINQKIDLEPLLGAKFTR